MSLPARAKTTPTRTRAAERSAARGGRLRRLLRVIGPGFVAGASDDDPSGIATYAAAGAAFGYSTLWIAVVSFPMIAAVQYICAKIGIVTGRGLAGVLRRHSSRRVLFVAVIALLIANTINAGADIGAVADAIRLLVPAVPAAAAMVAVAAGVVALQVYGSYRLISRTFKWLTLALLAYIGSALLAHPGARAVLRGTFVPDFRLDRGYLAMFVALLGTTISPYLFFWQASQEVEEQIIIGRTRLEQRKGATDGELRGAAVDVNAGMFFSNVVMYFIILACGATLHRAGLTHITTAAQAAEGLRPLAGSAASLLLALGLIGAGLLAIPVLTGSAAYAVAEVFGWRHSLTAKPRQARPFYGVIVAATAVGLLLNFVGVRPMDALVGSAILNGLLAPPLLVLVMRLSADPRVLGGRTNNRLTAVVGWITTAVMALAALALLVTLR